MSALNIPSTYIALPSIKISLDKVYNILEYLYCMQATKIEKCENYVLLSFPFKKSRATFRADLKRAANKIYIREVTPETCINKLLTCFNVYLRVCEMSSDEDEKPATKRFKSVSDEREEVRCGKCDRRDAACMCW